ncbi:hypothetical protein [Campylobacter sp. 19-13652]|uniref:hypothetical protein n=1 Tax=Campylobacter sp. 19-13652 TaxID=2840180 RepID=UPI001C76AA47|nr:hypothetical protein [Campylobacter sp. 19-13652]BCX79540.1 hypothetical protein LBC_10020 [Campylobacter sp. 19-13652]
MSRLCGFVEDFKQIRTDSGEVYEIAEGAGQLKNGVIVEFCLDEQGRASGLKAFEASKRYKVPDSFMLSTSSEVRGWQSINKSKFELIGEPNLNKTVATTNLRKHAAAMGANAIINYRLERFFMRWRARGVPVQIGQPSELFEEGLIDERDFSEICKLSCYIKKRLSLRRFLATTLSVLTLSFSIALAIFLDGFTNLNISKGVFFTIIASGFIWALVIKPNGAQLQEIKEIINE